jgi:outer membrane protein assembly factor BamA
MRGFREDGLVAQDRRDEIHREVAACQATINRAGCSAEAVNALAGGQSISEGGELFALAKAELRFPVFGAFDLGVFGEVGNLWLDASNVDWHSPDLRYVAGVGLRYGTPIGPLALDVGFNLDPDRLLNEQTATLHFSIGLF